MRRFFRRTPELSLPAVLAEGVLVGLCATQALDWLSIVLYENEDRATRAQEDAARGGHHAYEVAVAKLASGFGVSLDEAGVRRWGWRFHKMFGVLGGLGYVAMRRRFPKIGIGMGLLFGAAFFLVGDELLVPLAGLTPGPRAFPWKVHARGAASHVAYGVAAEAAARAIEAKLWN